MKILCSQEHYDKVVQYAESIGDTTLQRCLERLKSWEKNPNRPCEIGIEGGLLYHGRPDQSFAVLLEPFHGWSIHT